MATQRPDDEIDALLAQGRFPGPTRDRVLEGALAAAGVGKRPKRSWGLRLSFAAGASLALGAAAVLLIPRLSKDDDHFRAKGEGTGAAIEASCAGAGTGSGPGATCRPGETLVFSVSGNQAPGYLAVYAEPRGGGERIWYFSAEGETPPVPAAAGTTVFAKGIRIGPEHAPGEYVVSAFVTRVPLSNAALLGPSTNPDILASRRMTLTVAAGP